MGLYLLRQKAYRHHCFDASEIPESFEARIQSSREQNPLFMFWSIILDLELLMCRFIRSLREGDFKLYVQRCDELCAWFHVMDHTNYTRWLPVHVHDTVRLSESHPEVHGEFLKGNVVVQRTSHKFSLFGKDQSHEQLNTLLQAHSDDVGLYDNPEALTLFMLAGPECSRCIAEFETVIDNEKKAWLIMKKERVIRTSIDKTSWLF